MLNLSEENYVLIKARVERLYRKYKGYGILALGQIAAKILDDLVMSFEEEPATEIAAFGALADLYSNDPEVLAYLKREFEDWNEYFDLDYSTLSDSCAKALSSFINSRFKDTFLVMN